MIQAEFRIFPADELEPLVREWQEARAEYVAELESGNLLSTTARLDKAEAALLAWRPR